jgi:predicted ATPase
MKIKSLTLQNYKKFTSPKTISFCNADGEINDVTLILGNNGSGKSSILQAIILLVASVTRENFSPEHLDWPGYEYRHLQSGALPPKVAANIVFNEQERETTQEFAQQLQTMGVKLGNPPNLPEITLSLDFQAKRVKATGGTNAYYQFSGHQYAKRLAASTPNKTALFENVGNIYWYNEQRNSYSLSNLLDNEIAQIDFIRSFLASAYSYHIAVTEKRREIMPGQFDFYGKMQSLYKAMFPDREFVGAAPDFNLYEQSKIPNFFLSDGKNQYELSGMSAGERAIFPILMDFARWNINNSIIIIDEIELHLHPPLQQILVRTLPKLGKNNQFIITSHSNTVASMFDEAQNQLIRLPNE